MFYLCKACVESRDKHTVLRPPSEGILCLLMLLGFEKQGSISKGEEYQAL